MAQSIAAEDFEPASSASGERDRLGRRGRRPADRFEFGDFLEQKDLEQKETEQTEGGPELPLSPNFGLLLCSAKSFRPCHTCAPSSKNPSVGF